MKKKNLLLLVALATLTVSCGNSIPGKKIQSGGNEIVKLLTKEGKYTYYYDYDVQYDSETIPLTDIETWTHYSNTPFYYYGNSIYNALKQEYITRKATTSSSSNSNLINQVTDSSQNLQDKYFYYLDSETTSYSSYSSYFDVVIIDLYGNEVTRFKNISSSYYSVYIYRNYDCLKVTFDGSKDQTKYFIKKNISEWKNEYEEVEEEQYNTTKDMDSSSLGYVRGIDYDGYVDSKAVYDKDRNLKYFIPNQAISGGKFNYTLGHTMNSFWYSTYTSNNDTRTKYHAYSYTFDLQTGDTYYNDNLKYIIHGVKPCYEKIKINNSEYTISNAVLVKYTELDDSGVELETTYIGKITNGFDIEKIGLYDSYYDGTYYSYGDNFTIGNVNGSNYAFLKDKNIKLEDINAINVYKNNEVILRDTSNNYYITKTNEFDMSNKTLYGYVSENVFKGIRLKATKDDDEKLNEVNFGIEVESKFADLLNYGIMISKDSMTIAGINQRVKLQSDVDSYALSVIIDDSKQLIFYIELFDASSNSLGSYKMKYNKSLLGA